MATLDKQLQPTALKLLNKYGKSISYVQTTEGVYNPETSEATTTITTTNIKGLFISPSYGDIRKGIALSVDNKIIISALSIANPTNTDVIDGKYFVKYVTAIYSGDLVAYYELICESR